MPALNFGDQNDRQKRAAADMQQFSSYRPAQLTKPEAQGFIGRIARAVRGIRSFVQSTRTTEQGAASAASVITYGPQLLSQIFERQGYIADSWLAYKEDALTKKSVDIFCHEATRGGVKIKVEGTDANSKKAQKIANGLIKSILTPIELEGWARKLLLEGDLFIQPVFSMDPTSEEAAYAPPGTLLKARAMPGASMQRLSDDQDEIENPEQAYAQVDVNSQQTGTFFPEGSICHVRWCYTGEDRYGLPELIASRRPRRMLELVIESLVIKRMGRASKFHHIKVGGPKGNAQDADINKVKSEMGYLEGKRDPWEPLEALREVFTNSEVEITEIAADITLSEIADIELLLDIYGNTLPTPLALMGVLARKVARDVLEDQRAMWLTRTGALNQALDYVVRYLFEIALLIGRILPEDIDYASIWTASSIESPSSRIQSHIAMVETQLLSRETAIHSLREYTGVVDVDAEMKRIEKEQRATMEMESEFEPEPATGEGKSTQTPKKRAKIPAALGALPSNQSKEYDENNLNGNRSYDSDSHYTSVN